MILKLKSESQAVRLYTKELITTVEENKKNQDSSLKKVEGLNKDSNHRQI
jgi:hypothetical protein